MGVKIQKMKKLGGACALAALVYVSKQPVEVVERICKLHDFENNRGMFDEEWIAAAKELEIEVEDLDITSMSLANFTKAYPEGLYFLSTKSHLFVLDNKIAIDPVWNETGKEKKPSPRRVIHKAWRIVE